MIKTIRLPNIPVLPLDCHLPTQNTTHTIKLQQWTNSKRNKGYKQLIYIYISHVNVTQTVPDISPLMPMHQDPLLVYLWYWNTSYWSMSLMFHMKIFLIQMLQNLIDETIFGSDYGLASKKYQAITWTNCYPALWWPTWHFDNSHFSIIV